MFELIETRLSIEAYFIQIAEVAALRGTCPRRRAGAVLTDSGNKLLSIGYNGNPSGHAHCIDVPCPGALEKSGQGLDKCEAIHAEINAIGSCLNLREIFKCYVTVSPCIHCVKSLLATQCYEIIFIEQYPHLEAKVLWEKSNRKWTQYNTTTHLQQHGCTGEHNE